MGRAIGSASGTASADGELDASSRVHAVRKRCKRLRGLPRLVRPALDPKAYRRADRHFRDVARRVSSARDAAVFIVTYDRIGDRFEGEMDRRGTASIRAALTRHARARDASLDDPGTLARLADDLERGHALLGEALGRATVTFDDLVAGYARTREQARSAMRPAAADGATAGDFHAWRKRAKYHRTRRRAAGSRGRRARPGVRRLRAR